MATVNNYETTANLLTLLQQEIGDENASTSSQNRYISLLNRAYLQIYAGGGELNYDEKMQKLRNPVIFPWAMRKNHLTSNGYQVKRTGTVSMTLANTTISGPAVSSQSGRYIRIVETGNIYRLLTHTTIDSAAVEDTGSYTYEEFILEYEFRDNDNPILLTADNIHIYLSNGKNYKIPLVDRHELDNKYPLPEVTEGVPKMASLHFFDQDDENGDPGVITIKLSHYPREKFKMELPVVVYPTQLSTVTPINPVMPHHHTPVLVHLAAYWHLQSDDDDRANYHIMQARRIFESMVGESQYLKGLGGDPSFGAISPWGGNEDTDGSDLLGGGFIDFSIRR